MKEKLIFTIICFSFALCSQAQSKQHIKVAFTGLMYATYCDTVNLDFRNTEVKALAVLEDDDGFHYTEIPIVPAGMGILVHAMKPGVYEIPVTSEAPEAVPTTLMIGTLEATTVAWTDSDCCHNYILQNEGFKRATGKKLKAHRAYLHAKYDITKQDAQTDQLFKALLAKEQESAFKLVSRLNNPWMYRLLGVLIFFVGYALYRWTKKRYRKM